MLKTKEKRIIFSNKYIELQNNLVEDIKNKKTFEHIKVIENGTSTPGAVILCEYKDKILLIESYRYGIDEMSWEFPRGYIKENELLEDCAIRELYEETSIAFNREIDKLTKLGEITINSSYIASKVSLYLITINQEIHNLKLQDSEYIKSFKWTDINSLFDDIKSGLIKDSFTINTLMYFYLLTQDSSSNGK